LASDLLASDPLVRATSGYFLNLKAIKNGTGLFPPHQPFKLRFVDDEEAQLFGLGVL